MEHIKAGQKIKIAVLGSEGRIGKPTVEGAKVSLKFIESAKGKKIRVLKYKAKSRYRKKMGFRPIYSRLSVEKISCE